MGMEIEQNLNKQKPFEVELTNEERTMDAHHKALLRDQALLLKPDGMEYLGSMASHIYAYTDELGMGRQMACANVLVGNVAGKGLVETCSEPIIVSALGNLQNQVWLDMGHEPKATRNEKDLRE